jgi:hypothetical protein
MLVLCMPRVFMTWDRARRRARGPVVAPPGRTGIPGRAGYGHVAGLGHMALLEAALLLLVAALQLPSRSVSPSLRPSPPTVSSAELAPWRLPSIDWAAGGVVGRTDRFAVRAFDIVRWPGDGRWYMYCDLVLYTNPVCPSSFGSEIGCFSAPSLDAEWTFHGIRPGLSKNHSAADAGGLATPTAIVRDGKVFVYFAYEGLPASGGGLRGIGGASASDPLGPFERMPPVAEAPAGWHRPSGPGGILDDPEVRAKHGFDFPSSFLRLIIVFRIRNNSKQKATLSQVMFHAGRFHLFNSRKHLNDRNCSLRPEDPTAEAPSHCMEWHTSPDGLAWTRRGVLTPPPSGVAMGQTKSARVYGDQLVIIADGGGQRAFVANASGLAGDDPAALSWSPGRSVQQQMNMSSFYGTENTCFSRHFILKTIFLPRQARDKHRKR